MTSIERLLQWFQDREGRVHYSMAQRNGQLDAAGYPQFDCSSAVYYALINAGFLPAGHRIGNTDSLFGDLEKAGWSRVASPQRGDIFIWGVRGASSGAAGHTGAFKDAANIIHCAYGYNGIHSDNHAWLRGINGNPTVTYYRYTGTSQAYQGDRDQNLDVGSTIRLDNTYSVDDVQLIDGIWQVRTDALCHAGFTWADNGIPAAPLVEVDAEGYATPDQNLERGSKYVIPGKYTVLDIGQFQSYWLALIEWNGLKFWIDVETVTEIMASDAGKATPGARPAPQPTAPTLAPKPAEPEAPVEPKAPPESVEEPEPAEPTKQPDEPVNGQTESQQPTPTKPKEDTMAFTQEQQNELAVHTQKVLDASDFTPVISDRVKTIAYFATDITATTSGFVLAVLALLGIVDGTIAIMLNAALVAAMLGFKDTFRISAKKQ